MRTSNHLIGMLNFLTFLLSIPILGGGIWLSTRVNNSDCLTFLQYPLIVIGVSIMVVSLAGFAGACYRNTFLMYLYLWAMFLIICVLIGFVIFAYVVTDKGSGRDVLNRGYKDYYLPDYSGWLKDRVSSDSYWRKISSCVRDSGVCRKTGRVVNGLPEAADDYYRRKLNPIEINSRKNAVTESYGLKVGLGLGLGLGLGEDEIDLVTQFSVGGLTSYEERIGTHLRCVLEIKIEEKGKEMEGD
ncbi:tetraspanin-3-like protein [Tanacetum coccineum]